MHNIHNDGLNHNMKIYTKYILIIFCNRVIVKHLAILLEFNIWQFISKKSPRTSSIVQITFSFWPFEISENILRNQKSIIGLDSFSNQGLIYLAPFCVSTTLLKVAKLQ